MKNNTLIRILIWPLPTIYSGIVWIRNRMFDYGILKQKKFPVPVIIVGNLSAGGTGKTPHIIHLASELSKKYSLVILSRGYGRKTKGFRWVAPDDDPLLCGDEPLEIKNSLPDIAIATDGNRRRGIKHILEEITPAPDMILMDDGFQHRWVKPAFSLILTRADNLFTRDSQLPSGRLRESKKEIKRAEAVCVTGCTSDTPTSKLKEEILKTGIENIYFSEIVYRHPDFKPNSSLLLVTSIAHPGPLLKHLQNHCSSVKHLRFNDHHKYTNADIRKILSIFDRLKSAERTIVTTGKDWVKLKQFARIAEYPVERIEINISLLNEEGETLTNQIQSYVEQYSRKY